MPLTSKQDLPNRPNELPDGWSSRSLIVLRSAIGTIAKTFNALEAILLFEVFVAGIGELAGRKLSLGWYAVLGVTLAINAYLRITSKGQDQE